MHYPACNGRCLRTQPVIPAPLPGRPRECCCGGQAGADVQELPDAQAGHKVMHHAGQERAAGPGTVASATIMRPAIFPVDVGCFPLSSTKHVPRVSEPVTRQQAGHYPVLGTCGSHAGTTFNSKSARPPQGYIAMGNAAVMRELQLSGSAT